MTVNLRGIRESGTIFAAPTYIFLGSVLLMVGLGVLRTLLGQPPQVTDIVPAHVTAETFGLLLLMRAFADGCSAMTGTEAVANGVPAFKPPEWQNARTTMLTMAILLGTMFLGTSFLAHVTGALPAASGESVLSQIGRSVYGPGPLWYLLQLSTMGILVLAAQTSFADFPRVASILARDGYMPRQFAFRGERLAFNAGIVVLAGVSVVLVVAFQGRVEALIPLYAIGVFTAFTLSQAGMVRHWFTERGSGLATQRVPQRPAAPPSRRSSWSSSRSPSSRWVRGSSSWSCRPSSRSCSSSIASTPPRPGVSRSGRSRSFPRHVAHVGSSLRRRPSRAPWCRRSESG